jgi:hypothetical protein
MPILSIQAIDKAIIVSKLATLHPLESQPFIKAMNASMADQRIDEDCRY